MVGRKRGECSPEKGGGNWTNSRGLVGNEHQNSWAAFAMSQRKLSDMCSVTVWFLYLPAKGGSAHASLESFDCVPQKTSNKQQATMRETRMSDNY